ncbi:MAG: ATP-binding protein, partial [Pseudomonadota bacterium]
RVFTKAAALQRPQFWVDKAGDRDVIRAVWPVVPENQVLAAYLVVGCQATAPIKAHIEKVRAGLESYRQLKKLQDPIKITHYIALTIVALLSVFISTWIAFHLAKGITGPIMELAEGTDKIAKGDYDFTIEVKSTGEIGTLVGSFNRMTRDLKAGKTELTQKNIALQKSNTELDQRRRYMETILQNVAAGVISADAQGLITIINHSAEEILKVKSQDVLSRPFTEILAPEYRDVLEEMIRSANSSPRGYAERHVRLKINGQGMNLKIHLSRLKDQNERELGLVIVVDDLTELEKAQRMTAWREVARRIAHEIKNPLTPIQLSAQRLRRKYAGDFGEDGQLFDECTLMIIRQVEELKRLVGEFSNFARLPEVNPTPNDLAEIVSETLMLYQEAHKEVEFVFERDPELPVFNLDREQIKRALINLLDNAVAAVDGHGRIEINLVYNKLLKMARLEVADNGAGIDPADRARLFEPYFSTKKHGTGLGLAIVSTIVAGHNGYIRVQDNQPHGTRFIIELPARN